MKLKLQWKLKSILCAKQLRFLLVSALCGFAFTGGDCAFGASVIAGGKISAVRATFAHEATEEILASLRGSPETAYLQRGENELKLVEATADVPTEAVVFQKISNGLPILGGFVIVYLDSAGNIAQIDDDSSEQLVFRSAVPQIAVAEAERLAASTLTKLKAEVSSSKLVWFREGDSARLAWQVETKLEESGEPVSPTDLMTTLDALSGELLSQSQIDSKTYEPGPDGVTGIFPRIVINDSVGAVGSQNYAAGFQAVVSVTGCTATLIAPNRILSARHCGLGPGGQVRFGANSASPVFTATIQSSFLPAGAGSLLDGGDVAILTLTSNVPATVAAPMRLIDETTGLVGDQAAMIGYGFNGVGSVGHGFSSDGLRWGGENRIDVYGSPASSTGSNIISTDFDNGTGAANAIPGSSSTPVFFEATTAPGDSGGPVMVQLGGEWLIAGVLSGGTSATSQYGDISWWTGTALFRTNIESFGGDFLDAAPPSNDNWTNTIFLGGTLPVSTTGTNVGASVQTGEQQLEITGTTVWWYFTAPADGFVTVDTFGSDFDTVLHIYTGFELGFPNLIPVADNDQAGGTNQSQVTFAVNAGQCYEVRVGGYFGDTGNIDLNLLSFFPPPPNDNYFGPQLAVPFSEPGTNEGATTEAGEPDLAITAATVWWFFVAPTNGNFTIDTFGSDFDTVLHVYTGFPVGLPDLTLVATNDQAGGTNQSEVTIPVVAGECYDIRIGGYFGDTGDILLNGDYATGVLLGDVNMDGVVNLLDVAPFVALITGGGFQIEADINGDGVVNLLDVAPFIDLLTGP